MLERPVTKTLNESLTEAKHKPEFKALAHSGY